MGLKSDDWGLVRGQEKNTGNCFSKESLKNYKVEQPERYLTEINVNSCR